MYTFKRFLLFSLIPILVSSMHLSAMTSNSNLDRKQALQKMQRFHNRAFVYLKCISRLSTCTPEEREIAGKTIQKDIAIMASALAALGFTIFLSKKYAWPRWKQYRYDKLLDTIDEKLHVAAIATQDRNTAVQEYNRIQTADPNSAEAYQAYKIYETKNKLMEKARKESDYYFKKKRIEDLEQLIQSSTHSLTSGFYTPDPTDAPEDVALMASLRHGEVTMLENAKKELHDLKSKK